MQIAGLQKTTLVDFPGKIAATVFTRGCSFRCPFCHNPELVLPDQFLPLMDESKIMDFFEMRKDQLQGVCITGGEPTLQKDLPEFIQKLKDLGYAIKLDTNGFRPTGLEPLILSGNIDYIAMDIKSSPEKYSLASGSHPELAIRFHSRPELVERVSGSPACHSRPVPLLDKERLGEVLDPESSVACHSEQSEESQDPSALPQDDTLIQNIKKSIKLIMQSGIDYEFRTTVCHPIHEVADFEEIGKLIKGAKRYFIQNFVKSKHNDETINFEPFTDEELTSAQKIAKKYIKQVKIR